MGGPVTSEESPERAEDQGKGDENAGGHRSAGALRSPVRDGGEPGTKPEMAPASAGDAPPPSLGSSVRERPAPPVERLGRPAAGTAPLPGQTLAPAPS